MNTNTKPNTTTKLLCPGKTAEGDVFITVERKGDNLSISGVIGPRANGNCRGSCGQIEMSLAPDQFTKFYTPWTSQQVEELLAVWRRWHLNDMRAGSPAQEQWLREHHEEAAQHRSNYLNWACLRLTSVGLHPDLTDPEFPGYKYGSKWRKEPVPQAIWDYLAQLPVTRKRLPEEWSPRNHGA